MEPGLFLLLLLIALALSLFAYGLFLLKRVHRGTGLIAGVTAVMLLIIPAWLTAYTVGPFLFGLAAGLGTWLAVSAIGDGKAHEPTRRRES